MKLSILPARDGDCIVLTYGSAPRRHVVIDGGRGEGAIARLQGILTGCAADGDVFELLVVTHFDADHIEGVQHFLRGEPTFAPLDVWFNGFDQVRRLPGDDVQRMNEAHADALSSRLSELGWPVNRAFNGGAACLSTTNAPVRLMLGGGLEVTLLSPDVRRLEALGQQWKEIRRSIEKPPIDDPDIQRMGKRRREIPERLDVEQLASSRSSIDRDLANGSSIAFLASFEGRSVLLAADAHPDLLRRSVESLIPSGSDRLPVDLMKVSHHGSGGNTTGDLIETLDVTRFVISTDGSRHQHPNPEAIARLLAHSPVRDRVLYFNYAQDWTSLWNGAELRERYQYECVFPDDPGFLVVDV